MKICIVAGCEAECAPGRRYCREHYLSRKREQAKVRYKTVGHTRYKLKCSICGKEILAPRKTQLYCMDCYKAVQRIGSEGKNQYENAAGDGYCWKHRLLADKILGRKLGANEIVHHLDGDPKNNELTNLIVIARDKHVSLHAFLRRQAVTANGKLSCDSGEFNIDILSITDKWLIENNVEVIRLSEVTG